MDAKQAWEELEQQTGGNITAENALLYLVDHADGWVETFARMVTVVVAANADRE